MRAIILAGFLGSGKTTILMKLVAWIAAHENFATNSLVVIENEIGEANVDGRLLENKLGYEVKNLTAGCICCTLTGDLLLALDNIKKEINPRWIIIEATGLAHQTIAEIVRNSLLLTRAPLTITLADAQRWDELMDNLPLLITQQLNLADIILVNKADTVTPETLEEIKTQIEECLEEGPRPIHFASALNDDLDALWTEVLSDGK